MSETRVPNSAWLSWSGKLYRGSHIAVKATAANRGSYINGKGFPSINLLAVCDKRLKFRFTFSDCPGSVHDARTLQ